MVLCFGHEAVSEYDITGGKKCSADKAHYVTDIGDLKGLSDGEEAWGQPFWVSGWVSGCISVEVRGGVMCVEV